MSIFGSSPSLSNLTETAVTVVIASIPVAGAIITATVCGIICVIGYGLKKYYEYRFQIEAAMEREGMGSGYLYSFVTIYVSRCSKSSV